MIYSLVLIAASAAVASAQGLAFNATTGVYTCPASNLNGAYCAGDSGVTNIIIRCTNGIGQPDNCDDNLAGSFPVGVNFSPCWQTSTTSGDAACSKNCIVHASSGTFPVPGCSPSTTMASYTTAPSSSATSSLAPTSTSGGITVTSTGTTVCVTSGTTTTETFTTTYCPESTLSTMTLPPTGGSSSEIIATSVAYPTNGTSSTAGSGATTESPTATPVGPTTTPSPSAIFTGAAMSNSAGAGLAAVGLFIAYIL